MLGTDVEFFVAQTGQETIIPALAAFETAKAGGMAGFSSITKDIAGPGFENYDSLEVVLSTAKVTEDGAAIETPCNPGTNAAELLANVLPGVKRSVEIAKATPGGILIAAPVVWLDPEHIATRNELRVLGCAPDRALWPEFGDGDGEQCVPKQDPEKTLWRTGGGHIHFSPSLIYLPDVQESLVLLCDLVLGTLDVMLEHGEDAKQRRSMYGQPGKHRIQPWGVEYRAMSNAWFVNPNIALAVLEVAEVVEKAVESGFDPWPVLKRVSFKKLIDAVIQCDPKTCARIFLYTVEKLDKAGLDVTSLRFDLFKEVYRSGGIGEFYGYDMESWVNA
jgi:hypothetical protein